MYKIGQQFTKVYPPEAAHWCNANRAHIERVSADDAPERVYEIVANPKPTQEMIKKRYERMVQRHLDKTAQSRGYDDTYTCLSYLSSTDEVWRTEANAFNAWRDAVWRRCHEILNAFMAEEIKQPTIEEVIAMLPAIEW